MVFGCVVILDLYLFHEVALLNPCFMFSRNLILSLIDKVTSGTLDLALFIWNAALVVAVTNSYTTGSVFGSIAPNVLDTSVIIHSFDIVNKVLFLT